MSKSLVVNICSFQVPSPINMFVLTLGPGELTRGAGRDQVEQQVPAHVGAHPPRGQLSQQWLPQRAVPRLRHQLPA